MSCGPRWRSSPPCRGRASPDNVTTEPRSRRRRRKKIIRKTDGSLYDLTERRRITHAELKDYIKDGGLFEARRQDSGADCTYEVLQGMVGTGLVETFVP